MIRERAESLLDETDKLMDDLVKIRKEHNLTIEQISWRTGYSKNSVEDFELEESNPTLSFVRRYALAVGARLKIEVEDDYKG